MIYVITTTSGKELEAASEIRRCGYEAYVPRTLKRRRNGKDCYYIAEIMFDGYVFVAFSGALTDEQYYRIRDLKYTRLFLSRFSALSPAEEEYIMTLCNSGMPVGVSSGYIQGGKLYIKDGFLKKYADRIIKYSVRQHKATIEIPIYGEPHRITCTVDIEKR